MVLLVDKLQKLYNKLEDHHHHTQHQPDTFSANLEAFRSDVSGFVNQLSLNLRPGSEILSLTSVEQCFQLIPSVNRAFAKLAVEIDYPMSKWSGKSVEAYLSYSLSLLEFSNLIISALSYLGQARLSLSYALSLVESSPASAIERLKAIKLNKVLKFPQAEEVEKEKSCSRQETVIHQALTEIHSTGLWACCIVLAGLSGDSETYLEMRKSSAKLPNSSLINLDTNVSGVMMAKGSVIKEIRELNDSVACLASDLIHGKNNSSEAEKMQKRLESFERKLDGLRREVDCVFSEVLAGRNKLLNGIRIWKQDQR
ncbi:hypothetical protein K2173_024859 [Erythroxylum novogranatense]|uniref:Uncharacterized protein n=1 Tax=Erythroxylum novogranatense TaxID=1862640 RepID=A0AAV8UDU0_9ROSI|nr:hypothetical protein K2173_024859 [Erythroxylum novogranatense]